MSILDAVGNEVNVGDEIIYPGRSGSSLWMVAPVTVIAIADYGSRKMLKVRGLKRSWDGTPTGGTYVRNVSRVDNIVKVIKQTS